VLAQPAPLIAPAVFSVIVVSALLLPATGLSPLRPFGGFRPLRRREAAGLKMLLM
jgi:hypothetical protein